MTTFTEFDNLKVNGDLIVFGCTKTIETIINKQIELLPPQEVKTEDMVKKLFDRVVQLEKELVELKEKFKREHSLDDCYSDCDM